MRFLALILALLLPLKAEACRQALVMALDVSGSVNSTEYRLQLEGLAQALTDPEIVALILADPNQPIKLSAFEWSARDHQRLIFNWQAIHTADQLAQIAALLRAHQKNRATLKTAIGSALEFAATHLKSAKDCWQATIDVSGDGKNNDGPVPRASLGGRGFGDIVVNALVIVDPSDTRENQANTAFKSAQLEAYYHQEVIHGPGAFTEIAYGYGDYAEAMKRKLLRELAPAALSLRMGNGQNSPL